VTDPDRTLGRIGGMGLIAVVRGASRGAAIEVSRALVEGGVEGLEVTFTTPEAHRVLQDLGDEYGDRVLLGAGTVLTPGQVERSATAGARFLVSPGCDPDLVPVMRETGLLALPGVLTPSEVMLARSLGTRTVKLFPGSTGGPAHLKALRGPFPEVAFLPTGGVSPENVAEWFGAGAIAVGAGGALAPATLDGQDRGEVVAKARAFVEAVRAAKDVIEDPTNATAVV